MRTTRVYLFRSLQLKIHNLDTKQSVCWFEIQPYETIETKLVYIRRGCVCIRTLCNFTPADDNFVHTDNYSDICICYFTMIMGCNFNYSAPFASHQLLQSDYSLYQDLSPTSIGMNLTVVRKFLCRKELKKILKKGKGNGKKNVVAVHHDAEEIHHVLERVKKDSCHHWWDPFIGGHP